MPGPVWESHSSKRLSVLQVDLPGVMHDRPTEVQEGTFGCVTVGDGKCQGERKHPQLQGLVGSGLKGCKCGRPVWLSR